MALDSLTGIFAPVSDVVPFTHRNGLTFLQIQETLRKKINELVAAMSTVVQHVDTAEDALLTTFNGLIADINTLVETFEGQTAAQFTVTMDAIDAKLVDLDTLLDGRLGDLDAAVLAAAASAASAAQAAALANGMSDPGITALVNDPLSLMRQAINTLLNVKADKNSIVVRVADHGAVGNGIVDDTLAIQAAIDLAELSGFPATVLFNGKKVYSVSEVHLKTGVTLNLAGATLRANAVTSSCVVESPGASAGAHIDDAGVINGILDANFTTYGCVWIQDATRITVSKVTCMNMKSTASCAIRIDKDTSDCVVSDNNIQLPLDQPFGTVASSSGVALMSNVADDQSGGQNANLTFVNPTQLSQRHHVRNNRINGGTHGVALIGASRCTIAQNVITGQGHRGIILSPRACDNTITGNTLQDFNSTGIHMAWGCVRNAIVGNTLRTTMSANEGDGIKGYFGCSDNVVSGNYVQGVVNGGVRFAVGSSRNVISGNRISACKFGVLIESKLGAPYYDPTSCPNVEGSTITGNMIDESGVANGVGIQLVNVGVPMIRRVSVTGNVVAGPAAVGIKFIEPTAFAINGITAVGNAIDATVKWDVPREAAHFQSRMGNDGACEVTRTWIQMSEQAADIANPASNDGVLYLRDNGAGKTQLCVRFATGVAIVLSTQV